MAQIQTNPHLQTQVLCICKTVKFGTLRGWSPKATKLSWGCPHALLASMDRQAEGLPWQGKRCSRWEACLVASKRKVSMGMQVTDAGMEIQTPQVVAAVLAGGCLRCYLGWSPASWSDRSAPASSHSPQRVLEAAHQQWKQHEPAGERVRGGAVGAAGEGGKAHPAGRHGRTVAAWQSSPGCPSWSPRPGTLFAPEAVPRTERLAAASSGWWLSQAV